MKVIVIKIKIYQLKNILIKLNHTKNISWLIYKNLNEWTKFQWTISTNFIYFKDTDEEWIMHSKSDDMEVITDDDTNEIIEKLYDSLLSIYQIGLETQMWRIDFNLFVFIY